MTEIELTEFKGLPTKEQNVILFQGQQRIECRLEKIQATLTGYKLHQKVQYSLLGLLTTLGGYLLVLHLK
jgi:hypothetical protein